MITTAAGARRLGGGAVGLSDWQSTTLSGEGKPSIEIVATPCRHGPPGSRPLVGDVIGFALRWEGQRYGALWISGDTVLYDGVREVPTRLAIGTVLLHLGGVQFPVTGPLRYTMTAAEAVELLGLVQPRAAIPIHYEGWKHFKQGREAIEAEVSRASGEVRRCVALDPDRRAGRADGLARAALQFGEVLDALEAGCAQPRVERVGDHLERRVVVQVEPRHAEPDVEQRALAPGAAPQRAGGAEDDAARGLVGPPPVQRVVAGDPVAATGGACRAASSAAA